ncbi:hypothetical protein Mic7113_5919 [Allocoleopsis franciscana PCC 7113]|uniref:Uncharacterized protein n=1 Tax=Allocoleopsis franciscana PCC 7113 TaxID=1173027 RepID=K9WMU8_9CYAN|nr:hypothetical protein Mic7113_5919 [Allocoleopsis franciscana PCC 7113]
MDLLILMLDILMTFCGYQISKNIGSVPFVISILLLVLTLALIKVTTSTIQINSQEYLYFPLPIEFLAFLVLGWVGFQQGKQRER